jgi:ABC-type transporter Mla subunit MlaD
MSLPTSPLARLVSGVSTSVSQVTNSGTSAFQSVASDLSKLKLDQKIADASGALGSGLNGATSFVKNTAGQLGANPQAFAANLGAAADRAGAAVAGAQSLANAAAATQADITNAASKLAGGSLATGFSNIAGAFGKAAGTSMTY